MVYSNCKTNVSYIIDLFIRGLCAVAVLVAIIGVDHYPVSDVLSLQIS